MTNELQPRHIPTLDALYQELETTDPKAAHLVSDFRRAVLVARSAFNPTVQFGVANYRVDQEIRERDALEKLKSALHAILPEDLRAQVVQIIESTSGSYPFYNRYWEIIKNDEQQGNLNVFDTAKLHEIEELFERTETRSGFNQLIKKLRELPANHMFYFEIIDLAGENERSISANDLIVAFFTILALFSQRTKIKEINRERNLIKRGLGKAMLSIRDDISSSHTTQVITTHEINQLLGELPPNIRERLIRLGLQETGDLFGT